MSRYQKRVSGPLLDRIDIFVEVPRVAYEKLSGEVLAEPSYAVRDRVEYARAKQSVRLAERRLACNADMGPADVREHCQAQLDEQAQSLLRLAMAQLSLSARGFHRVLKLARTIADLDDASVIAAPHIAEAIQYRRRFA